MASIDAGKTIFDAAREGDLPFIKHKIEVEGFNPLTLEFRTAGKTILHYASLNGRQNVVKYLINEVHMNINAMTNEKQTALHEAAFEGQWKIVQFLVEQGADLDLTDNFNETAICKAAYNTHWLCVFNLIEHGIDLNRSKLPSTVARGDELIKYLKHKERKARSKRAVASRAPTTPSMIGSVLGLLGATMARARTGIASLPDMLSQTSPSFGPCATQNANLTLLLIQSFLDWKFPVPRSETGELPEELQRTEELIRRFENGFQPPF